MDSSTDLHIGTVQTPSGVDFQASKYNRLLYGEGYLGWALTVDGFYCRIIPLSACSRLNEQDLAALSQTLHRDAAINAVRLLASRTAIAVMISIDDFARLKAAGIGARTAGMLAFTCEGLPAIPAPPYRWQSSPEALQAAHVLSLCGHREAASAC